MIKISIITITFNSEKTLLDTINSVRNQKYPNLEYLIIDGGSTDHTIDIIKSNEDIITKWISEKDEGISDAFNKGINLSSGDVIGIINSDDMLVENSLIKVAQEMEKDNVDVVFGNAIMFGDGEKPYRFKSDSNLIHLKDDMSIVHPTTFIKKNAYLRYGTFDKKYKCSMDRELLLRMYTRGAKFCYLDEDLAMMRLNGVNQRTYGRYTLPESINISILYGQSSVKAYVLGAKRYFRFLVSNTIKKMPFANVIKDKFHSKYTEIIK